MPKRSAKTEFSPELKLKLLKIAKFGFSESETALLAKISAAELKRIKELDPEFGRDYKKAELEAQLEAEAAFHNRACGYQTTEVIYVYIPSAEKDTGDKLTAGATDSKSLVSAKEFVLHSETICGNDVDIKNEIRKMIEAGLDMKLKEIRFVKKFLPPDTSSCNSWLINRRSERWSKNPTGGGELDQQELARLRKIASAEIDENS